MDDDTMGNADSARLEKAPQAEDFLNCHKELDGFKQTDDVEVLEQVDIAEEQRAEDIFLNHSRSNGHFNAVYFAADVEMSDEKRADDFESPSSVPAKGKFFKKTTSVKYFIQTSVQSDYYEDSELVHKGKPMESLKETDAIPATVLWKFCRASTKAS
ncbi:hypothetical protein BV898_18249 [Hypsibius exemplaris]|uniref:Uncharacterized protein n=1 Tax=Hypsibius exemplaris TaxID=2072580 RepID=A0A9X6RNA9_HYPEX|nr:hypothetical protein BV898_18249 [Hypsibius exemplaris]